MEQTKQTLMVALLQILHPTVQSTHYPLTKVHPGRQSKQVDVTESNIRQDAHLELQLELPFI